MLDFDFFGPCLHSLISNFYSVGGWNLILFFFLIVLMEGYKALELNTEENSQSERALCQAVADMKFTYVVSCQQYGIHKRAGDHRAQDILKLMTACVCSLSCLTVSSFHCSSIG